MERLTARTAERRGQPNGADSRTAQTAERRRQPNPAKGKPREGQTARAQGRLDDAEKVGADMRRRLANSLNTLASLALIGGRLAEGERLRKEARAVDRVGGAAALPLGDAVDAAWADAWFRSQPERAARRLDSALAATPLTR